MSKKQAKDSVKDSKQQGQCALNDVVWRSCWRKRGLRLDRQERCARWPEGQNWVATAICIQQVEARCLES